MHKRGAQHRATQLEDAADRAEQAGHADRASDFRDLAEQAWSEHDALVEDATRADEG